MPVAIAGFDDVEGLRGVAFPFVAGLGGMEELDLDLRVRVDRGDDGFFILSPHDDVITEANHCGTLL
jgi:hypothetical protein